MLPTAFPPDFEQNLDKYAEVIVKVGLNLQPGQRLLIPNAPIEAAPFIRRIAAHAYQIGSPLVDVWWADPSLDLVRLQNAPRDSFSAFRDWQPDAVTQALDRGDSFLRILAEDPDILIGQDANAITTVRETSLQRMKQANFRLNRKNEVSRLFISFPIAGWNAKVFPDLPADRREAAMWDAIFSLCRITTADPVASWQAHDQDLKTRSGYLNHKRYAALKYTAPGTDLTVGLPDGHLWMCASMKDKRGNDFVANIPTEEVFTMPHRDQVNGVVTSTRPISIPGVLIENFTLWFEHGIVVKATAEKGEADLHRLLDTDDGMRHIGEIALVPNSSPISQSGLLFYNTLYDENAACHIALGASFPIALETGLTMTEEQLLAAGGNVSKQHLDFMIGSGQMDIDGMLADGTTEPIFRAGEWTFQAT